jgi:WD repeat-containing protein 35
MFCCLYKKVTVHNSAKLGIICCNKNNNTIGIGGSDGFVKIIQIDLLKSKSESNNNPLTFTQNLVCHKKKILVINWNDNYNKITTCDEEGVIIVWKLSDDGKWETEMINNREVSYVSSIKWSKQGNYLCFM